MIKSCTLAILIVIALAGLAQNSGYVQDPSWQAPAKAAAKQNPLAGNPGAAIGGRKLFQRECAECHGQSGNGVIAKKAANLQLPSVQEQSDGTLFWKITNGNPRRGMPSFSSLPEMQRWQLVLYLRTLNQAAAK
jgi:mono/diheme cytochrome c family protein